ncbi:MAG: hypothetical protein DCC58_06620 [Chloroflexi bacterium]|nr:MAG: hypothetical protein DCC58_06620 [Chloroflexota bacterium]
MALVGLVMGMLPLATTAYAPEGYHFTATWERTDRPVAAGVAGRTWMWGPEAFTPTGMETYMESPGGMRQVQYFDKSRMEITDPSGDGTSPWFVTNGLLVVEMVTGRLQLGNDAFGYIGPSRVNVAGDPDDPTGPMYESFSGLLNAEATPLGSAVVQRVDRAGRVTNDPTLAARGVTITSYDDITRHAIPSVFWEFMNSSGTVWEDGGYVSDVLFLNPFYATGRPITEPYWANVKVAGTYKDVLLQCFERRCLTYTPGNPAGWQVEAGNVGRHYYAWRYHLAPVDPPSDGLLLYSSSYDAWASWPIGHPRDDEPRLLGSPLGGVDRHEGNLALTVPGGANTWVAARSARTDYADVHTWVRMRLDSGVPGDIGCLLTRVVGSGSLLVAAEYKMYALCLDASGAVVAFYYEDTPSGTVSTWLIPPGAVAIDAPVTSFHALSIRARGHDFWFSVDGELLAHVHHEAGPLEGAVGVGVRRLAPGAGIAMYWFRDFNVRLNH